MIQGSVPSIERMPQSGDRFAARIPWISAEAHEENPTMHEIVSGHQVRCTCYKEFYFKSLGESRV